MPRKNKIILSMLLACTMLFTTAAAYEFNGEFADSTFSVNHSLSDDGTAILVYIFDTRIEADTVIDEALMQEHLIYAGTDSSISLDLEADAPYGVYSVVLGSPVAGTRAERIKYVLRADGETIAGALSAILGSGNSDAMADALAEYNNKAYILELDDVEYVKNFMFDLINIKGITADNAEIGDIAELYAEAGEYGVIKSGDKASVIRLISENKDVFELDEDIDLYADDVADIIIDAADDINSITDVKEYMGKSLALAALNGALTSKTIDVIEKYNHIFNADIPVFKNDTIRYQVEKILESTEFTDVTEVDGILREVYEEAKEKYEDEKESTGSGSSGSGGGSRGGSGGAAYISPSAVDTKTIVETTADAPAFSDLGGYDWAKAAVEHLFSEGIVSGDGSGRFRPGDSITREEFVKILIEALGGGKIEERAISFADVSDDAWYKSYVATAYNFGIVTGETATTFGTGKPVTRQDAAVMLVRAADAYFISFAKKQTLVNFGDYDTVSDYAQVAVDTLARAQIINGFEDGTFRPMNIMTRAEVAKLIYGCITVN